MSIGNNIKRLRIEKKLTQKKLSELTGISEVMISQYELGLRNPKLENLQKIAKALNVHSLVLLDQISQDLSDELLKDMETEKPSFIDISLLREIFGKIDIKKEMRFCICCKFISFIQSISEKHSCDSGCSLAILIYNRIKFSTDSDILSKVSSDIINVESSSPKI